MMPWRQCFKRKCGLGRVMLANFASSIPGFKSCHLNKLSVIPALCQIILLDFARKD